MSFDKFLFAALIGLAQVSATAQDTQAIDPSVAKQFVFDLGSCGRPPWPPGARERGEKGRVELKYRVDLDGKVLETVVIKSSGFASLDEAAAQAVRQCRYTSPAQLGYSGPVWAHLIFNWTPVGTEPNSVTWENDHKAIAAPTRLHAQLASASCVPFEWPHDSLVNEEEGTVRVRYLVGEDGKVRDAKILSSSSFRGLDQATLDGIRKCTFRPATENGKPVQSWEELSYVWEFKA